LTITSLPAPQTALPSNPFSPRISLMSVNPLEALRGGDAKDLQHRSPASAAQQAAASSVQFLSARDLSPSPALRSPAKHTPQQHSAREGPWGAAVPKTPITVEVLQRGASPRLSTDGVERAAATPHKAPPPPPLLVPLPVSLLYTHSLSP
jgi:hypothetical protein